MGIVLATILGTAGRHRPAVAATGCWRGITAFYVEIRCATSRCCCSCCSGTGSAGPAARRARHSIRWAECSCPTAASSCPLLRLGDGRHAGRCWPSCRRDWHLAVVVARCADGRQEATGTRPAVWPVALAAAGACRWRYGPRWARRSPRHAGAARLQLPGRRHRHARILRAADRPGGLHRHLYRRDRPVRHPGRAAGASGRPAARSACAAARCCARSCCRRRCA